MRSRWECVLRAAGAMILLLPATWVAAQDYKVVLDRPEKVGQEYKIHATGHARQAATINVPGLAPQNQGNEFTMELDGTVKVLAVDDKSNQPTKLQCTVAKCLKDQKPLLEPGTVLTAASKEGKTAFSKDGVDLDPATSDALGVVIETHQPGTPSDSQTFGTDRPQPVGGTWPINAEAAAASAAKSGITIPPDRIKGTGKLVAVKEVDGKTALQVEVTMDVANLTMPEQKVESGTVSATFGGLFPTDPSAFPLSSSQTLKIRMKMNATTPDGRAMPVDTEVTRSSNITYSPADK